MSTDAGGKSALSDGLGITDALQQMIDEAETAAFAAWVAQEAPRRGGGHNFPLGYFEAARAGWNARSELVPKCRGVVHIGCDYIAACGSVCNKCGRVT